MNSPSSKKKKKSPERLGPSNKQKDLLSFFKPASGKQSSPKRLFPIRNALLQNHKVGTVVAESTRLRGSVQGEIAEFDGQMYEVLFQDGSTKRRSAQQIDTMVQNVKDMLNDTGRTQPESTRKRPPPLPTLTYPIGTKVAKYFDDSGWYEGEVVLHNGDFYKVRYTDGDSDENDSDDLAQMVEHFRGLKPVAAKKTSLRRKVLAKTARRRRLSKRRRGSALPRHASLVSQCESDDDKMEESSDDDRTPISSRRASTRQSRRPQAGVHRTRASPGLAASRKKLKTPRQQIDDEENVTDMEEESPGTWAQTKRRKKSMNQGNKETAARLNASDSTDNSDAEWFDAGGTETDEDMTTESSPSPEPRKRLTRMSTTDAARVLVNNETKNADIVRGKRPSKTRKGGSTTATSTKSELPEKPPRNGGSPEELLRNAPSQNGKRRVREESNGPGKTKNIHTLKWTKQAERQSKKKKPSTKGKTTKAANPSQPAASGAQVVRAYTDGKDLPPIAEPQEMFRDMISNQLCKGGETKDGLAALLRTLHHRPLRVATMCSGTESPILALDMIATAIEDFCRDNFDSDDFDHLVQIEHVFSCEIEPYKQAYIERNFAPPLLFRDIRELGNDQAHTAYGSLVNVPNTPGCVDLLIAGTSCVDYSNLNNKKKKISDKGESGQTWRGMIEWVRRAQPPLVILENILGAPWAAKVDVFEKSTSDGCLGNYHAQFATLDTKKYYIPHTRQRGYLLAVRRDLGVSKRTVKESWKEFLKDMERPASANLDAFMLPPDDPRVLRGRARLTCNRTQYSGDQGRVDWDRCQIRHHRARDTEGLGDKRVLTGWSESSSTTMPPFAWNEWVDAQVHRVHDLMDINTLRLALCGVDCTFKTMVWNLSQNVDRSTMGKLGLCQCLTPTGVPYVTNRGGPLVGEELLLLQGIPADDLLFTKETEENLKDLAGNAMTSTVVGACMLGALVLAHKALGPQKSSDPTNQYPGTAGLVRRPLSKASEELEITRAFASYIESTVPLAVSQKQVSSLDHLLRRARLSAKLCPEEGNDNNVESTSIVACKACGQTSSISSSRPPRKYEEHDFRPFAGMNERVSPTAFRRELLDALPMCIQLHGLKVTELAQPAGVRETVWSEWLEVLKDTTKAGFRFSKVERLQIWVVTFVSTLGAKLVLQLDASHTRWLLYASSGTASKDLVSILAKPIARLAISSGKSTTLFEGDWEVRLPYEKQVDVHVHGTGEKVESWKARLGVVEAVKETRYSQLKISLDGNDESVKSIVDGVYTLLPKCGSACGSLHKRTSHSNDSAMDFDREVFLFLESEKCGLGEDDVFVVSHDLRRTTHGEYRDLLLKLEPKFRLESVIRDGPPYRGYVQPWTILRSLEFTFDDSKMFVTVPTITADKKVPLGPMSWRSSPEVLSCRFPFQKSDKIYELCKHGNGAAMDVNTSKSSAVFEALAFAIQPLEIPATFQDTWLALDSSNVCQQDGEELPDERCAPRPPTINWTLVTKGGKHTFVPLESGKGVAEYDQAMRRRPLPWIVRIDLSETKGTCMLQIGCNAASLANRALALFPTRSFARRWMVSLGSGDAEGKPSRCQFDWRIVPHVDQSTEVKTSFPRTFLTSNKRDEPASQPPGFSSRYPLRPEQLRSLAWMLHQEANFQPFLEEEVSEALLPRFGWRAEARVRRPVLVRGGIIADEVGYGKTAISLGLIKAAKSVNGEPPPPPKEFECHIITPATLVIVPTHLTGQWPHEIEKFLGKGINVCVVKDMTSFNNLTVRDIEEADVVVANFNVLNGEKYLLRLARLAGVDIRSIPAGKVGGRHFEVVYEQCLKGLAGRLNVIKNDCANCFRAIESDARKHENTRNTEVDCVRLDRKKSVYDRVSEEATKQTREKKKLTMSGVSLSPTDRDPWKLGSPKVKRDFRNMQCPPLELFFWNRVVIDEFHYLAEKNDRARVLSIALALKSSFRWCLSGTPPCSHFNDIQGLARLLGIHLGTEDSLPGVKLRKKASSESDVEKFSNLLEVRSLQWHERRHLLAQDFLNRFVRQNVAEIDEIKYEEHSIVFDLLPAEKAIYLELETHLTSLEFNKKRAKKSKKSSTGDRQSRMNRVLENSETAEEALLKCCSHFSMKEKNKTALETCEDIIAYRKEQLDECETDLIGSVAEALVRRMCILEEQPDWKGAAQTLNGEVQDRLELFLRDVENGNAVTHGADDEIQRRIQELVKIAQSKAEHTPAECFSPDTEEKDEDLLNSKYALREHMHSVQRHAKELCGRMRSLRYFRWVRDFQLYKTIRTCRGEGASHCECGSGVTELLREKAGVLSCCGHIGCIRCLRYHADREECVDPSCKASVKMAHVVSAVELGADKEHSVGSKYGTKLAKIVEKVTELTKHDRVIVFVQFDDLKQKVAEALNENGVRTLEVAGGVAKQIRALNIMQKEVPDKNDPRVFLLKMDHESSAGVNLTTCNHAVFVHPLLAETQQQYEAYETQAIGRIRRYGQMKTVHVWRYLARETIDTTIFTQRTGTDSNT